MILLIDNYDSFTYNIAHALGELGCEVRVERNDALTAEEALALSPEGIVLSPGPGRPENAGICNELVDRAAGAVPVLGICLGHQCIAERMGGSIRPARRLVHGKTSHIYHDGSGVFAGLPSPLDATRYHSLAVSEEDLPECLSVSAQTTDGEIMGLRHRSMPLEGVQFHPESILTESGKRMFQNFLRSGGPHDS